MDKKEGAIGATRLSGSGQLVVRFATSRDVLNSDGNYLGRTNEVIGITTGKHTIVLGDPQDYTPASRDVQIVASQLVTVEFSREGV